MSVCCLVVYLDSASLSMMHLSKLPLRRISIVSVKEIVRLC
jgi:hypothetical protein